MLRHFVREAVVCKDYPQSLRQTKCACDRGSEEVVAAVESILAEEEKREERTLNSKVSRRRSENRRGADAGSREAYAVAEGTAVDDGSTAVAATGERCCFPCALAPFVESHRCWTFSNGARSVRDLPSRLLGPLLEPLLKSLESP